MTDLAELLRVYGGWGLSAILMVVVVALDRRVQALHAELRAEGKQTGHVAMNLADRNAKLIAHVVATIRGAPRG